MIEFVNRDLFSIQVDIRVNTVNCVGVMGKGIALEFKKRYPDMFDNYREACKRGEVRPGKLHHWSGSDCIVNMPTKRHWRDNSTYEDVGAGLEALRLYLVDVGKRWSVALPPPGCGNGGLDWTRVKPMVVDALGSLPNTIYVFEP